MARLVSAKPAGARLFAAESTPDKTKEALTRAAQYVPAEVLAAYLAITSIVEGGTTNETAGRTVGLLVALVVGAVFTPLYLNKMAVPNQPKRLHIMIGTFAFLLWSYGMKGFWDDRGIYNAVISGVLLVVFSLISGLLAPTEGSK